MTTVRQCVLTAAEHYGVSEIDILSPRRSSRVALPRQVAYWLAHETTLASHPQIARTMRRERSTVSHGVMEVERRRSTSPIFRAKTDTLRESLFPPDMYGEADIFHALAGAQLALGEVAELIKQGHPQQARRDALKESKRAYKTLQKFNRATP